jgi:CRP/FNR family transcriptional regulator
MGDHTSVGRRSAAAHDHRFQCVSLVPVFAALPEEDRHRLAATARTRHYDRQEMIFVPGDRPGLHIVHRGQVKTYRVTETGGEQLLRIVGPGDFLGETAMLTSVEASDFAVAIQPSEVCSISRDDLHELLERNPAVTLDLLEAVAGRLHAAEEQLSSMSGLSVAERLAKHLLEHSAAAGTTTFRLASTKKDLAAYLGTTAETLSRRLSAMQDGGLVRLGPARTVEILDPDGLRAFHG